jgi:hypothetical protein
MLGMKAYPREYIDACRTRIEADVAAYGKLAAATTKQPGNSTALQAFESRFFNDLVLLLDQFFVHRLRTVEGKDGNPLNEVRVLCESMLLHGNVLTPEKTIKLSPEKSVLKLQYGDEIKLSEADFLRLFEAFFAEMEQKFV